MANTRDHSKKKASTVIRQLSALYELDNLGNQADPTDELFFIVLSAQTTGPSYTRTFDVFAKKFRPWDKLLLAEEDEIAATIKNAGLSNQRAAAIKTIALMLFDLFGAVTLEPLKQTRASEAEQFLLCFPRIGIKTARCILSYSLDHDLMPLDTHCYRILNRLGLLPAGSPNRKVMHDLANDVFRLGEKLKAHVLLVKHGRAICRAIKPRCTECPLIEICDYHLYQPTNSSLHMVAEI